MTHGQLHPSQKTSDNQKTSTTPHHCTLADLPAGAQAHIAELCAHTPQDVLIRLQHLGFRAGTVVTKIRTAPLGDPCVYRLLGYDTCLRRHEASYITVSSPL